MNDNPSAWGTVSIYRQAGVAALKSRARYCDYVRIAESLHKGSGGVNLIEDGKRMDVPAHAITLMEWEADK